MKGAASDEAGGVAGDADEACEAGKSGWGVTIQREARISWTSSGARPPASMLSNLNSFFMVLNRLLVRPAT
ncbi:MAG: hypothetical protein FRX49_02729 [Trebouxia sp. A1-2]|nr:MAG: hypothetical protein FRX49_02729 [Trebouxia sp. A1-2]